MNLSKSQKRMLILLDSKISPFPPGVLGCELWKPGSPTAKPQSYARPAGRLLNALQRLGYAKRETCWGMRQWGWVITRAGRIALRSIKEKKQ